VIEVIVAATALIVIVAIAVGIRRAKRRLKSNPNDIYPLW
jgi:hypothetical protein